MFMDSLMGVKKPDLNDLKEVKVKLPVKQLLRLHYLKLTTNKNFSDIVAEALVSYFGEPAGGGDGAPEAPLVADPDAAGATGAADVAGAMDDVDHDPTIG